MVIKYKREDFLKMLDDFNEKCKGKHYTRIDYSTWKSMINGIKNTNYVYVDDSDYPKIRNTDEKGCVSEWTRYVISAEDYFSSKNKSKWHMVISPNDRSFCDFLLNFGYEYPYVTHKSKDDMTKNNFINEAKLATCSASISNVDKICSYDLSTGSPMLIIPTTGSWSPNTVSIKGDVICDRADSIQQTVDRKANVEDVEALRKEVNDIKDKIKEKENNMFKFDFGSCEGNTKIAMSMYGLALRNGTGSWVSYDANSHSVMNVDILNSQSMNKYMYRIPVAIKDIAVGDTIIHNSYPMFVSEITHEGKIVAVDVAKGEEKIIMPTKNIFGFNFCTKIVSLFDMSNITKPCAEQPFGNMWMLAMMDGNSIDPMMLMMMNGGKMDMSNPLMMYMLMKDKTDDILPLAMMMNMNK